MSEVYRKWGCAVRYENGRTVRVEESGEAIEAGAVFRSAPLGSGVALPEPDAREVGRTAGRVQETCRTESGNAFIERLIVIDGVARHETNGVTWMEVTQRVHVSLVNSFIRQPLRALIDLASFEIEMVSDIAGALARAGDEREAPARVRLAPNVTAALLPALIGELALEQRGGGFDGKGQVIETRAVTAGPPPNWYRPSYSIRPRSAWLNLRALPFGTIDRSAPRAVALLAPVSGTTHRVLCIDGDDIFPTMLHLVRVAAVSADEPVWYPYEGGSFGIEMML
jgi:hypothetical protein